MKENDKVWIGADPGGAGNFGIAIVQPNGSVWSGSLDHADEAISAVRDLVKTTPSGVGVDAPLWWSSGKSGLRKADQWIRDTYDLPSRNVQAINSLWGSVLVQGVMFVQRLRECFPKVTVKVTETHPKAVLAAFGTKKWRAMFAEVETELSLDAKPDHERDALISAMAAREGFSGRWRRDLSQDRYPNEQDPSTHWLAPVHYYWPI